MKIAVPLDENQQDVCVVFSSRAVFFVSGKWDRCLIGRKSGSSGGEGGAGIQAAQFLVDNQVTDLITVRCGQNAADVFHEARL